MGVYDTSCTDSPEGLCPILLVFGTIPRPARSTPALSQIQRIISIEAATRAAEKQQATWRNYFRLRQQGIQVAKHNSTRLTNVSIVSPDMFSSNFQFVDRAYPSDKYRGAYGSRTNSNKSTNLPNFLQKTLAWKCYLIGRTRHQLASYWRRCYLSNRSFYRCEQPSQHNTTEHL